MDLQADRQEEQSESGIAKIPPQVLLKAYRDGYFPMAHEDGALYWHDPEMRAVFPLDRLVPDARTARHLRSKEITITIDAAFERVIRACADRRETWIDPSIIASYLALHRLGHAHSLEVWRQGQLAGGIYGVSMGGAFFGESMFNRRNNMGRVAFHALVAHLKERKYVLFDSQYINPFTAGLGAIEIPRGEYHVLLARALESGMTFK